LQIDGKLKDASTGQPSRLVGVVTDVTLRKRLEARSHRFAERLIAVQEDERRSISQELHDSTVQHLVAASLTLMNLRPATPAPGETQKLWDDLEMSLGEAMGELRSFSFLMHPPVLRVRGLHLRAPRRIALASAVWESAA
jgi:signal transduction histidine kinase